MPRERESPLAKFVPTRSEPRSPGPRVKAMASMSWAVMPARRMASLTTGTIFCSWARDASSGTTPPYAVCTAWEAMTLLRSLCPTKTAAEVSSHELSIPNMMGSCCIIVDTVSSTVFVWHKSTKTIARVGRGGRNEPVHSHPDCLDEGSCKALEER